MKAIPRHLATRIEQALGAKPGSHHCRSTTSRKTTLVYGFAGTSLRGIIKDAKVNIAAVAYHYGNKEELFNAVVERFAVPVVTEQFRQLDAVENPPNLRQVLEAFYLPPLTHVKSKARAGQTLGLFLGRLQTEPEPIFSVVDKHFASCRNRFVQAFRLCSPFATEADLHMRSKSKRATVALLCFF